MNSPVDDSKVARLFARLREQDEWSIPSVDEVLAARPSLAGRLFALPTRLKLAAAALAAALILGPVAILWPGSNDNLDSYDPTELEIVQWNSPTDFLMDQDDELLSEIPEIDGDLNGWLNDGEDRIPQ